MRYAKRRDNNHTDIVEALRKANFEVIDFASAGHDIPDLLAIKPMHDGMAWICWVEVKAKDGTASIAIADSTGVASLSANPILSGGTANGVLYLNGSKVATSGSALVFDGTNFGVGTNTLTYTVNVAAATARSNFTSTTGTNTVWQNYANTAGNFYIGIENSAGTAFGTTAYSSVLWSTGATPIVFVF